LSFTVNVKQELNHVSRERTCCRIAELAALFRAAGSFHIHGGQRYGLHASFGLSATARTAVLLVKAFDLPLEVRVHDERRLGPHKRFEIHLEGGVRLVQFLNEIGVLSDSLSLLDKVPQRIIGRPCCRAAFLRGAFLAAGSVSGPGKAGHLEIYSANEDFLEAVRDAAASEGIKLSIMKRRRNAAAYSKKLKEIRDFLVTVGAFRGALSLEEKAIISAVKEDANRRANFDQANAARSGRAAARQVAAINQLQRRQDWRQMSPLLTDMAELRLAHPSLSMAELGLRADPPLSKSAVNHRLRRLMELADALR
jgi:DNA-binding protein WhiA